MSVPSIAKKVLQVPRGRHTASLETQRPISENVTFTPVLAGAVGYLNSDLEWETGLPATADVGRVPLILFQQSDDPDVQTPNSIDFSTEPMGYVSGVDNGLDSSGNAAPKGPLMLIGLDAFIIESRHYDGDQTYAPGNALTATNANNNAVTGGRLTLGTIKTNPICGIVYEGEKTNIEGTSLLSWITWFFPKLS